MTEEGKADSLRCLADDLIRAKRYNDAIPLYEKLVELHPDEDSLLLSLAWAYHDSGRQGDAVACFERLLEIELKRDVFTGFAFDELVRIFKETGDHEQLVAVCERVAAAQPDDVALLNDLGHAYLMAGMPLASVEVFTKMTDMEPDASANYCNLGNALIQMRDFDGAESAYRKAVEIDPSETGSFYNKLANSYLDAGHYGMAERAFRRCLEFRPDETMYMCSLGDILVKMGRIDEAVDMYERATDTGRVQAGAYSNRLGNTLARENHHRAAIEAFEKAIAADPRNPFYYIHLADSYKAIGLTDRAEETLRRAESLK
ncbi:MAG TPA: tetratricopeptide repeat protein [Syntrophales bacterium]|nr:tetratricopeptide repeat protein [Syntrophales bacterium]